MTQRAVKVWCPFESDEPELNNVIGGLEPWYAAELKAKDIHEAGESSIEVDVRDDAGELHHFTVYVDYEPSFTAVERGK